MLERKFRGALPAVALAAVIAAGLSSPLSAYASDYAQSYDPVIGGDAVIESADGSASATVPVTIDTSGGKWVDEDKGTHAMGTYVVTVPTSITFKGVNAGYSEFSADWTVKIAGIIPEGKSVVAQADTDHKSAPVPFSVKQGKKSFTAADLAQGTSFGDAYIYGDESEDSLTASGKINRSDPITGNINYTFTMV